MSTLKLTIEVVTEKELSEEQKDIVMHDMAARLHGYQTDPLLFLSGANITISRTTKINENLENKLIKLNEDFCKCEKPWSVSGKCIICHKLINID